MNFNKASKAAPGKTNYPAPHAGNVKGNNAKTIPFSTTTKIVAAALLAIAVIAVALVIFNPAVLIASFTWIAANALVIGIVATLLTVGAVAYVLNRNQNPTSPKIVKEKETNKPIPKPAAPKAASTAEAQLAANKEAQLGAAEDRLRKAQRARAIAYEDVNHPKENTAQIQMMDELKTVLGTNKDMGKIRQEADLEVAAAKKALADLISGNTQLSTK